MKLTDQLYRLCWILVHKQGIEVPEVSRMLGKSDTWLYGFFYNKGHHHRISIDEKMILALNSMGYDIQIVRLKKGEKNEQSATETS